MRSIIFSIFSFVCLAGGVVSAKELETYQATDLEAIREADGKEIVVEGVVVDIGYSYNNAITFLNMGLPKKKGFVAVIFRKDYDQFPEGFTQYKNMTLRVSGILEIFEKNNLPQIKVTSLSQITVVEKKEE